MTSDTENVDASVTASASYVALVSLQPVHLMCWHQLIFLKFVSLEAPLALLQPTHLISLPSPT